MFRARARETIGGMPGELLVRIDWVDDLPDGTVQDAARTRSHRLRRLDRARRGDPSPDRRSDAQGNK